MVALGRKLLVAYGNGVDLYRASACNAYRARYCYGKYVRPSVCPSNAGIMSKRIRIPSHFFHTIWYS